MRPEQWRTLLERVRGESSGVAPALIVDSPWIPPFLGLSTRDYITRPETHFRTNLEIVNRFPEILFVPGFWVEMGMAAEPSGFGAPVEYFADQPPVIHPILNGIEEADRLVRPNPRRDGLMPEILSRYREVLPRVRAEGMDIKIVAARGPMTLAAHLMGTTGFLVGLKTDPGRTHALLRMLTDFVKEWLEAQAEVLPGVEGIFILDDIMGFLCEDDYLEFAHGYFNEILSIPAEVKILHNDTPNPVSFKYLGDLGVNIFNFSHQVPIPEIRALAGDCVVLMGNISPLDIMVYGTGQDVYDAAVRCVEENRGNPRFLLSAGGGVSMGTPESSIAAIVRAAADRSAGTKEGVRP